MSERSYQCPGSGMMCPTPWQAECIYTRDSRDEFDHAQPGEILRWQNPKLMCQPAQERKHQTTTEETK